ncbi:Replication factor C, subunit 1 [Giardia muris]|uniref:Replication factor C, subunit 1 n=1 Tax=Giardia muris TaxID=5742 RepID=A0A4Z1SM44_GIAMU|nr:Replication factor C, subunit 1 [Giardia muris]|eukprot:TNJ26742.1 Replication factor C, subunit 1 [Giardia muris]
MFDFDADESGVNQRRFFNPPYACEVKLEPKGGLLEFQLRQRPTKTHKPIPTEESKMTATEALSTELTPNQRFYSDVGGVPTVFEAALRSTGLVVDTSSNPIPIFSTMGVEQPTSPKPPPRGPTNVDHSILRPRGVENCLANMTFVRTGQLESMGEDDLKRYISCMGGRVTGSVSGKTSYLIVGSNPGILKQKEARERMCPTLSEEEFFQLVLKKSKLPSDIPWVTYEDSLFPYTQEDLEDMQLIREGGNEALNRLPEREERAVPIGAPPPVAPPPEPAPITFALSNSMWIEEFRPKVLSDIIGNTTTIESLKCWLYCWEDVFLKRRSPQDVTAGLQKGLDKVQEHLKYRAALVHGAVGIGKTMAVSLVVRHCGYEVFNLTASDQRSKSALVAVLSELILGDSITRLIGKRRQGEKKLCVVVDECESIDAGGLPYLVEAATKESTHIPFIFICKEVSDRKLNSLKSGTADFMFRRPPKDVITSRINAFLKAKTLQTSAAILGVMVENHRNDIRHALMELQFIYSIPTSGRQAAHSIQKLSLIMGDMSFFELLKLCLDNRALISHVGRYEPARGPLDVLLKYYNTDVSLLAAGVFENYPTYCRSRILQTYYIISETLSSSELLLARMLTIGDWTSSQSQAVLTALVPNLILNGSPTITQNSSSGYGGGLRFPGETLSLSSSIRANQGRVRGFITNSKLLTNSSTAAYADASYLSQIIGYGWSAYGDMLGKKRRDETANMVDGLDDYTRLLVEGFQTVTSDAWDEFCKVHPLPEKTSRTLSTHIQKLVDYDVQRLDGSGSKRKTKK